MIMKEALASCCELCWWTALQWKVGTQDAETNKALSLEPNNVIRNNYLHFKTEHTFFHIMYLDYIY